MPNLLKPYSHLKRDGKEGFVLREESEAVTGALFDGACDAESEVAGRGRILRFPLGQGEGVLRTYQRGGLVARLLGDRYCTNRMEQEFRVTAYLHQCGAPVPEPLGVAWERRGLFYRGALATRAIPGETLLEYLQRGEAAPDVLRACGEAVRAIHDAGVWHADLQVKNILVGESGVWVIDFDNARRGKPPSTFNRARNLLRFCRSLDKHGQSLDNFTTLREGYGKLGLPWWLSALYRLRGTVSDALQK